MRCIPFNAKLVRDAHAVVVDGRLKSATMNFSEEQRRLLEGNVGLGKSLVQATCNEHHG